MTAHSAGHAGFLNHGAHLFLHALPDDGEIRFGQTAQQLLRDLRPGQNSVAHRPNGGHMAADVDSPPFKDLAADGSGGAQAGREPPGKMSAAAHVVAAVVMNVGRIVGVAGARNLHQVCVIARARVGVLDDDAQRRARGVAVQYAAEKFGCVGFLAGCGALVPARCAARHLGEQSVAVNRLPGGQAVDYHADSRAVAFTEDRDSEVRSPDG